MNNQETYAPSLQVYNASAGSGKTYTLAREYIRFALSDKNPNYFTHILAVTFTNKATGEMKERILENLYDLSKEEPNEDTLLEYLKKETGLSQSEIRQRASKTLDAILHDYDHFKVETIDAFFQSLLTGIAHELDLPRGFSVELDDQAFVAKAIDQMLRTIGDKENAQTRKLVNGLVKKSLNDDKGWNIAKTLKAFAQKILFSTEYSKNEEVIEEKTNDAESMEQLGNELRRTKKQIEEERDALCKEAKQALNEAEGDKDLKSLKNFKSFVEKVKGPKFLDLIKDLGKTIPGFLDDNTSLIPTKKRSCPSASTEAILSQLNDVFSRIVNFIQTSGSDYYTCELVAEYLDMLCLLGIISRKVGDVTTEQGSFLLARTPMLFSKLVNEDDSSFIFERAGTTYHHIMIDEFQDTSVMQWNNFRTLLINNLAEGKTGMLVGDVKQSIYRWRGGDWNILQNIRRDFPKAKVNPMDTNWRSMPLIVRFNDAFFTKAAAYLDNTPQNVPADWQTLPIESLKPEQNGEPKGQIQAIYQDVVQKPNKQGEGYVRLVTLGAKDDAPILDDMYEQIKRLHEELHVPLSEMKILVRKNDEGNRIVEYFAEKYPDCPLTSDEAFLLSSSVMVNCLILALKVLHKKEDKVSAELFRQNYHSLLDKMPDESLKQEFDTLCKDITEGKEADSYRQMPLYELVQALIKRLRFEEIEQQGKDMGQSAYLYSFMDELVGFLDSHVSDIDQFLKYWDDKLCKKALSISSTDAIQILTIHKSKGLEAHTVFIPFANFVLEDFRNSLVWCETQGKESGRKAISRVFDTFPILPVKFRSTTKVEASAFADDLEKEREQQHVDNINTLYVAFTRARYNLLVWSNYKGDSTYKLIDAFVNDRQPGDATPQMKETDSPLITEYGCPAVFENKKKEENAGNEKEDKNPFKSATGAETFVTLKSGDLTKAEFRQSGKAKDFLTDIKEEAQGNTDAKQHTQECINRGKLYHHLFEYIDTEADIPQAIKQLSSQGLIDTEHEAQEMEQELRKLLSDAQVNKWFNGSYKLFKECNILYKENGAVVTKRPDRVMVNNKEAIVVDYKFGSRRKEHEEQVKVYMEKIGQLLQKPVKGYLWYVSADKNEVIPVP